MSTLQEAMEDAIRQERKVCAEIVIHELLGYVATHPGFEIDGIAEKICDRKVDLSSALLDAVRDAETIAQRTVERCVEIADAEVRRLADHSRLTLPRLGIEVAAGIRDEIRSLVAPERVCLWHWPCYDGYGKVTGKYRRECDGSENNIPDSGDHCPGCGARIEIKE